MKPTLVILAVLAANLLASGPAPAQEIMYFGKMPGQDALGLIQLHGQYFAVADGDEIPGAGTIAKLTDDALIVRRTLTEPEKGQLSSEGRAAHAVEERHVANVSRFLGGSRALVPR